VLNLVQTNSQFSFSNLDFLQHDRARVIYKYALDHIPKEKTGEIYKAYTIHEKKYGDRTDIENVTVSKRKRQYEQVKYPSTNTPVSVMYLDCSVRIR